MNQNALKGLSFLLVTKCIQADPEDIAHFLLTNEGINKESCTTIIGHIDFQRGDENFYDEIRKQFFI